MLHSLWTETAVHVSARRTTRPSILASRVTTVDTNINGGRCPRPKDNLYLHSAAWAPMGAGARIFPLPGFLEKYQNL
jgi:hypothetical protein